MNELTFASCYLVIALAVTVLISIMMLLTGVITIISGGFWGAVLLSSIFTIIPGTILTSWILEYLNV